MKKLIIYIIAVLISVSAGAQPRVLTPPNGISVDIRSWFDSTISTFRFKTLSGGKIGIVSNFNFIVANPDSIDWVPGSLLSLKRYNDSLRTFDRIGNVNYTNRQTGIGMMPGTGVMLDVSGQIHSSGAGVFAGIPVWKGTSGSTTNLGVGPTTLELITSGMDNVAVGTYAGRTIKTANENSAFGFQALYNDSAGHRNSAFGSGALFYTLGSKNVASGSNAGFNNTSGSNNVYIGTDAGLNISTGSNNTIINSGMTAFPAYKSNIVWIGTNGTARITIDSTGEMTVPQLAGTNNIDSVLVPSVAGAIRKKAISSITVLWANITASPTTLTGYGITDAVNISGTQSVAGNKTFTGTTTVSGNAIFSAGFQLSTGSAAGKYLKSDASGNASWSDYFTNGTLSNAGALPRTDSTIATQLFAKTIADSLASLRLRITDTINMRPRLIAGANMTITGTYPTLTLASSGGGGGGTQGGTTSSAYIPYASGSNTLANSGLTWDVTNARLGLNSTSPSHKIDIRYNANDAFGMMLENLSSGTGAQATITLQSNAGGTSLFKTGGSWSSYKNVSPGDFGFYNPSGNISFINDDGNFNVAVGGSSTANFIVGTSGPAVAEFSSTSKGVLLPRLTKSQRDAIGSPVAGLAVYQTDNTPGLRVFNGTNWIKYTESTD